MPRFAPFARSNCTISSFPSADATMSGVTQQTYDDWRASKNLPSQAVKLIDPGETQAIYHDLYWAPIHGDQLPTGVDYATFDFAFNSGVGTASRYLQRAVGAVQDGVIGPQTLAVVNAAPALSVIDTLCDMRLAYLKQLRTWKFFGNGWANRVSDVRAVAKAMAA